MSNQVDHRKPKNAKNKRHKERPTPAQGCGGEGKNGQLGREKWKLMSRRNERRNLKQGRPASIGKWIKKTVPAQKNSVMFDGVECKGGGVRRKNKSPKPINPDTGEDE
jgi:hypothetical protein